MSKGLSLKQIENFFLEGESPTLITHFVWYLEKEKRYDIETLSIDRVLNKKHFKGKIMKKMCTKG